MAHAAGLCEAVSLNSSKENISGTSIAFAATSQLTVTKDSRIRKTTLRVSFGDDPAWVGALGQHEPNTPQHL